jgi:hypothetical protein
MLEDFKLRAFTFTKVARHMSCYVPASLGVLEWAPCSVAEVQRSTYSSPIGFLYAYLAFAGCVLPPDHPTDCLKIFTI